MSKSKHGEPWRFQHGRDITDEGYSAIVDCNGKQIGDDEDDRIIACVNALAGKNPDALGRFVLQAKMALEVLEAGPENLRISARALRKAMEDFGRETP